jgi:hypothetical protein
VRAGQPLRSGFENSVRVKKALSGLGNDDEFGIENMFSIVMRLSAYGGRRGPIAVRAALRPSERMRIDYFAIRFGYLT